MQMMKRENSVEDGKINVSSLCSHQQSDCSSSGSPNSDDDVRMKSEVEEQFEAGVKTLKKNHQKPHFSYIALISRAIQSHGDKKMLLSDIYEWIVNNFPSFKMSNRSWRNSVRHNLSLNECFIKCGRCDSGKGHYWGIHPANREDFAKGDYRRRHARRLVKKCDELAKLFESDSTNEPPQEPSVSMTSQYGYVRMTCTTVSRSYLIANFGAEVLSENAERTGRFYDGQAHSVRQYKDDVSSVFMSKNKQY